MARRDVEINADAFMAGLRQATKRMDREAGDVLEAAAPAARDAVRSLAPVRTGRLRDSIDATAGRDARGPHLRVTVDARHGHLLEFGTSKMAPRPFLRPGLDRAVVALAGRLLRIGR